MIKTRADLFEAAAKMMRICDEAEIQHTFKFGGIRYTNIENRPLSFSHDSYMYEFPLAIVEGKPVFVGDELYEDGNKVVVVSKHPNCDSLQWLGVGAFKDEALLGMPLEHWSWNPPTPATVMVELLREDAEFMFSAYSADEPPFCKSKTARIAEACRKALDK